MAALLDVPGLFAPRRPAGGGRALPGRRAWRCGCWSTTPGGWPACCWRRRVSPYGFGGTRDLDGTPTTADFAGTGGGTVNTDFVARLAAKDRGADEPASPRTVLRATYVADPASLGADEELLLDSVLSTVAGDDNYPGTAVASPHWPGTAPGDARRAQRPGAGALPASPTSWSPSRSSRRSPGYAATPT